MGQTPTGANPSDEPIEFALWARLSAAMIKRSGRQKKAILDENAIAPARWERSEQHWRDALSADLQAQNLERASIYGQAHAAEIRNREEAGDKDEHAGLGSTAALGVAAHKAAAKAPATPFVEQLGPPPAIAPGFKNQESVASHSNTVDLQSTGGSAALPFPEGRPPMSLEEYASLHAELALEWSARPATLDRYQLDETRLAKLDRAWEQRFASAPGERKQWLKLVGAAQAELISQRK